MNYSEEKGRPQNNAPEITSEIIEGSTTVVARLLKEENGYRTIYISENIRLFGYTQEEFLSDEVTWETLLHPADEEKNLKRLNKAIASDMTSFSDVVRIQKKDGASVWTGLYCAIHRPKTAGGLVYLDTTFFDYAEINEKQENLVKNLSRQKVMYDILKYLQNANFDDALTYILESTGRHFGVSRAALFMDNDDRTESNVTHEWIEEDLPEEFKDNYKIMHVNYSAELSDIEKALKEVGISIINYGEIPEGCKDLFEKAGLVASLNIAINLPGDKRYGFFCYDDMELHRVWTEEEVAFLQTISNLVTTTIVKRHAEKEIEYLAFYDPATGLKNRYSFLNKVENLIDNNTKGVLFFIDIDDFKIVNEAYGHSYGDALILEYSKYLKTVFPGEDQLFRFVGDQFMGILEGGTLHDANAVTKNLRERHGQRWVIDGIPFYFSVSVGIVSFPFKDWNSQDLVICADLALSSSKQNGKNEYTIYRKRKDNASVNRANLEMKMRESILMDFEGFKVVYHPIVDVHGHIKGAEALIRWYDEDGNPRNTEEFIRLAEYLGLIVPLGEFVLYQAATVAKELSAIYKNFRVGVNLSIKQLQRANFVDRVDEILDEVGASHKNMIYEVTEGLMINDLQQMKRVINQLRQKGGLIAMDDFGTGYSSLGNMRELPLDIIKIDSSFVRDISINQYSKTFIHLITDLCKAMNRSVCVEGVETEKQLKYCAECNVNSIQGYYFAKPMDEEKLKALVTQRFKLPI